MVLFVVRGLAFPLLLSTLTSTNITWSFIWKEQTYIVLFQFLFETVLIGTTNSKRSIREPIRSNQFYLGYQLEKLQKTSLANLSLVHLINYLLLGHLQYGDKGVSYFALVHHFLFDYQY